MKTHKLLDSFNAAIEGFLYVVKSQRNMRIHCLLALLVLFLGIYLNISRTEFMILCLTVTLVLMAEMFNTAIEIIFNHISSSYRRWVRVIKDIAAGTVLVCSINAAVVGYFLFFKDLIFEEAFNRHILKISQSDWHISFLILIAIIGIVIFGKTLFHKGRPLRGGMPSGHSAVGFAIWTLVALLSRNLLIVFIVFILAFLIAHSRIARHYHTFWEVLSGAATGIVVTLLMYRLFAV